MNFASAQRRDSELLLLRLTSGLEGDGEEDEREGEEKEEVGGLQKSR